MSMYIYLIMVHIEGYYVRYLTVDVFCLVLQTIWGIYVGQI